MKISQPIETKWQQNPSDGHVVVVVVVVVFRTTTKWPSERSQGGKKKKKKKKKMISLGHFISHHWYTSNSHVTNRERRLKLETSQQGLSSQRQCMTQPEEVDEMSYKTAKKKAQTTKARHTQCQRVRLCLSKQVQYLPLTHDYETTVMAGAHWGRQMCFPSCSHGCSLLFSPKHHTLRTESPEWPLSQHNGQLWRQSFRKHDITTVTPYLD